MINDSFVNSYSRPRYKEFGRTLDIHHFSEIHWSCSMSCITVITIISAMSLIIIILRVDYWSSWAGAVSWASPHSEARDGAPPSCMAACLTSPRLTQTWVCSMPGVTGEATTDWGCPGGQTMATWWLLWITWRLPAMTGSRARASLVRDRAEWGKK